MTTPSRIATTIASSNGEKGDSDVIDAHLKIGDVYKDGDAKQHQQALAEYQSGLKTCEAALSKRPDDFDLLRNKGKAFYRIAELLRGDNALADARAYYQKAFEVQNGLVSRNAQEAVAAQKAPDSVPEIEPGRDLHPLGTSRTGSREPGACAREIAAGRRPR